MRGFSSILIGIVVAAIVLGAGSYFVVSNKIQVSNLEPVDFLPQNEEVITEETKDVLTEVVEPAPASTPTPAPTPMPTSTPPSDIVSDSGLAVEFSALEQELTGAQTNGSYLSSEHSDRVLSDLDDLESRGYAKDEIKRLRQLVLELSPHLQNQTKEEVVLSPTPETCVNADPILTADITDFSKVQRITAPGSPSSEGPKGHSFVWTNRQRVPLYMPVDAVFDSGSYVKDTVDSPAQYLLFFEVKNVCDFQIKFDHVDEPVDAIKQNFSTTPKIADSRTSPAVNRVEFKTGDLIGYTRGTDQAGNWDFGLYNLAEKGALADSHGIHSNAVCWVDFYSPEKQTQYRNLLEGPELACSF